MELKKSAVDLTELAIGILILGIVVSIGAVILVNMRDTRLTGLDTYTITNETVTPTNAGAQLNNFWIKSVDLVRNITNATTYPASKYSVTIDSTTGTAVLKNLTSAQDAVYVTYTGYNTSRADWSLPNSSAVGLGEYGNWFKIIVITGVAALVLGIIFLSFGRGTNASQASEVGGSY